MPGNTSVHSLPFLKRCKYCTDRIAHEGVNDRGQQIPDRRVRCPRIFQRRSNRNRVPAIGLRRRGELGDEAGFPAAGFAREQYQAAGPGQGGV